MAKAKSTTRADLKALSKLLERLSADESLDATLRDCLDGILRSGIEPLLRKRGSTALATSTIEATNIPTRSADQQAVLGYALRQVADMKDALRDQAESLRIQAEAAERNRRLGDIESEEYIGGIFGR